MRKFSEMVGKCRICGAEYSCYFYADRSPIRRFMLKEKVCGTCASWMTRKKDPDAKEYVIDGEAYNVYPFQDNIGLGDTIGKKRYLVDMETWKAIKSNDVWPIGKVPAPFYTGDTAGFITALEFKAARFGIQECKGVACLDRYTCVFYDKEKQEPNGPVNQIPKDWVDGSERCGTYININKSSKVFMEWRKRKQ